MMETEHSDDVVEPEYVPFSSDEDENDDEES